MPNKKDPFAALMSIAQDQQGYFTTKQAIQAGYADNTHPIMFDPATGSGRGAASTASRIFQPRKTGR